MKLEIYSKKKYSKSWDDFVNKSINGTIFQLQSFLQYHITRKFQDSSIVFLKQNQIHAVIPAAVIKKNKKKIFYSHPGSTFGGVVYNKISFNECQELISSLINYLKKEGFDQIELINTPSIYYNSFDETLEYCLNTNGFLIKEFYISSLILVNHNLDVLIKKILKNKKRTSTYYDSIIKKYNISFHWEKKFKDFYPVLLDNKKIHDSLPTHSLDEIIQINHIMPQRIQLLLIKSENRVIGGTLLFIATSKIAIIFYNVINYKYKELQPATLQIIESIKWAQKNNLQYLDFGVSQQQLKNNPIAPSPSLIKFKEQFNASGFIRKKYIKVL